MNTNKENISWNKKKIIDSVTPFTLLDYKSYPSAILWFSGCNMRCDFCYNKEIVLKKGKYCFDDIFDFFNKRKELLKGVVLCGGEPTVHKQIYEISKRLKSMGYKIKLDTNGLNTKLLKKLISKKLIDYVAIDFKGIEKKFENITKVDKKRFDDFCDSLKYLKNSGIDYEIRTTYHEKLLSLDDINKMLNFLKSIKYDKTYYLQNFLSNKENFGKINTPNTKKLSSLLDIKKYPFLIKFRNF